MLVGSNFKIDLIAVLFIIITTIRLTQVAYCEHCEHTVVQLFEVPHADHLENYVEGCLLSVNSQGSLSIGDRELW